MKTPVSLSNKTTIKVLGKNKKVMAQKLASVLNKLKPTSVFDKDNYNGDDKIYCLCEDEGIKSSTYTLALWDVSFKELETSLDKSEEALIYHYHKEALSSDLPTFSYAVNNDQADFAVYEVYEEEDFVEFDLLFKGNFIYHFHIMKDGCDLNDLLAIITIAVLLCLDVRLIEIALNNIN